MLRRSKESKVQTQSIVVLCSCQKNPVWCEFPFRRHPVERQAVAWASVSSQCRIRRMATACNLVLFLGKTRIGRTIERHSLIIVAIITRPNANLVVGAAGAQEATTAGMLTRSPIRELGDEEDGTWVAGKLPMREIGNIRSPKTANSNIICCSLSRRRQEPHLRVSERKQGNEARASAGPNVNSPPPHLEPRPTTAGASR